MNRPIHILTIAARGEPKEQMLRTLEAYCDHSLDMAVLPELWLGDDAPPETPDGETISQVSRIAKKFGTYLLCPLYTQDKGRGRVNSAVLLGRDGRIEYVYEKVFPYWDELKLSPPCEAGSKPGYYETDFGRIGIAVCFDVHFTALWRDMALLGAEIVFWTSDYSGGASLRAHAVNHHYYIVSTTRDRDCAVIDITGKETYYSTGTGITVSRVQLDLDREIFHQNFNQDKIARLLSEHHEILLEQNLFREQWMVLSSNSPKVSVKTLAAKMGIEPLRSYKFRSEREINPHYGGITENQGRKT